MRKLGGHGVSLGGSWGAAHSLLPWSFAALAVPPLAGKEVDQNNGGCWLEAGSSGDFAAQAELTVGSRSGRVLS